MANDPNLMSGPMCEQMFSTGNPNLFPEYFGILGNGWFSLSLVALLTSLLILALVYMAAAILRNQQLISWTKFELYQVLATAVVVLFTIYAIVGGLCHFDLTFLGEDPSAPYGNRYIDPATGGKMSMYDIVQRYFDEMIKGGNLLFMYMMYVVKQINFLAKVMWLSSPLGVGSSESPLESLGQMNNLLFIMVSGYIVSYLLLYLQLRMVEYLTIAVLYFLFPFGIFFRAFEPTRTFGGTLIGLSISLMLFYPILLVFNDYIVWKSLDVPASQTEVGAAIFQAESSDNFYGSNKATYTRMSNELQLMRISDESTRSAMMEGFSTGIVGGILFLLKPIMQYFIGAVVLPVIDFILLVEITRGVTHFFGEEIDITNLTRLI